MGSTYRVEIFRNLTPCIPLSLLFVKGRGSVEKRGAKSLSKISSPLSF